MTSSLLTVSLIAATSLAACATESDLGDEMDVEITSKGGKSDAINGKRLRIRAGEGVAVWQTTGDAAVDALADLSKVKSMSVDAATADLAIVSGNRFELTGTNSTTAVGDSPWAGAKKLRLAVAAAPGAGSAADLGFILFNTAPDVPRQLGCTRGAVSTNFFHTLVIDLTAREVLADATTTFTFAECGIPVDGTRGTWELGTFTLPLETTGSLKGTYNYKLEAELL